jgi:hypothetical protein
MTDKAPEFVPSVSDYVAAFKEIEGQMTDKQFQMLREHYKSFCYITTATDLAIKVEYNGAGGAKLQYGKLGSMVSNALGLGSLAVITLALMGPPDDFAVKEWLWVMRANVAQALEQLGWVEKTSDLFYPNGGVGVAKYIPD